MTTAQKELTRDQLIERVHHLENALRITQDSERYLQEILDGASMRVLDLVEALTTYLAPRLEERPHYTTTDRAKLIDRVMSEAGIVIEEWYL